MTTAANDDLNALGAVAALRLFRSGELSPVELLRANLEQIDRLENRVNAVTELIDTAKEHAAAAEKRYRDGVTEPIGVGETALLGLPVAAKEKHQIEGRSISQCMVGWKDQTSPNTHEVVRRIHAAGGFVHARTTSPEFSCATTTHTPLHGVTRNPHAPEWSPGGSSGGSGAALAAGYGPLATASDIAGSTRIPAGFSGVVGYKAPYGRIPGEPPLSVDWYRGDGPMARSVADTALLANVMSGISPRDHRTVPGNGSIPVEFNDAENWLRGAKIAYSVTLGDYPVHREIADALRATVAKLAAAGAIVEEVTLPWTTELIRDISMSHYGQILGPAMAKMTEGHTELAEYTKRFIADTLEYAAKTTLPETLAKEAAIQADLVAAMHGFDVLLTPVNAVIGLAADGNYLDGIDAEREDGTRVHLKHYWECHMTVPFNINNSCPVLAVPIGVASNGVPIGMQIVGHPYKEVSVFRAGAAVEAVQPWNPLATLGKFTACH